MYHVLRQTDKGEVSGKNAWSGAQVWLPDDSKQGLKQFLHARHNSPQTQAVWWFAFGLVSSEVAWHFLNDFLMEFDNAGKCSNQTVKTDSLRIKNK